MLASAPELAPRQRSNCTPLCHQTCAAPAGGALRPTHASSRAQVAIGGQHRHFTPARGAPRSCVSASHSRNGGSASSGERQRGRSAPKPSDSAQPSTQTPRAASANQVSVPETHRCGQRLISPAASSGKRAPMRDERAPAPSPGAARTRGRARQMLSMAGAGCALPSQAGARRPRRRRAPASAARVEPRPARPLRADTAARRAPRPAPGWRRSAGGIRRPRSRAARARPRWPRAWQHRRSPPAARACARHRRGIRSPARPAPAPPGTASAAAPCAAVPPAVRAAAAPAPTARPGASRDRPAKASTTPSSARSLPRGSRRRRKPRVDVAAQFAQLMRGVPPRARPGSARSRNAGTKAWRRGDELPMRRRRAARPAARARRPRISRCRADSRAAAPPPACNPAGRSRLRSLYECTVRSTVPARRAASISAVKNSLPSTWRQGNVDDPIAARVDADQFDLQARDARVRARAPRPCSAPAPAANAECLAVVAAATSGSEPL